MSVGKRKSRPTPSWFDHLAKLAAWLSGRPITFLLSVGVIVVWLISGRFFEFSDTWQLVINTGTTIITFLMVFLIQNTQNRDTAAVHVKLDELIRAVHGARNTVISLEDACEEELQETHAEYAKLAEDARLRLDKHREQAKHTESSDRGRSAAVQH